MFFCLNSKTYLYGVSEGAKPPLGYNDLGVLVSWWFKRGLILKKGSMLSMSDRYLNRHKEKRKLQKVSVEERSNIQQSNNF
jgi:hypothetical protein